MMFDVNCCKVNNTPYVVFNNIKCIFRKSGVFSYLSFCKTEKTKKMLNKCQSDR